ncbi:hypothetical protein ECC02_010481 [Trypanosoma cruzi]|uniref:Uncharacterized protein n=1 Tax=Trypanosoma cruzi TaxID=5693 RepID=A0A7J6XQE7_TRYCR|nr:hypothetical protein ECC02_010481 [Trypanosoma cruzi]
MEHRSNLNIFRNIRGQFMKVQRRDRKFKGACEPVSDHPRRRIATPTLQGHLNDVKYFHRMAPTTQSRGINYRLAAPRAMRQSKTVSNTACDKGTERRCSKYPPHLSSSNHPVKGRSTRQYPRTQQIWHQKAARRQMPKGSHFFSPDTSTDECNCRALRPLDPFETTLRPHGEGSMWLAIRSSRRGKTVQKVGWRARTFASLMPASTARVKLVFPTAALRVAETPALTAAMTSASACNSSTQPVRKTNWHSNSAATHPSQPFANSLSCRNTRTT